VRHVLPCRVHHESNPILPLPLIVIVQLPRIVILAPARVEILALPLVARLPPPI
jgi:hypothetical protein